MEKIRQGLVFVVLIVFNIILFVRGAQPSDFHKEAGLTS